MVVAFAVIGTRVREREIRSLHDVCACFVDFFFPYSFPLGALSIREIIIYIERNRRMEGMAEWKEGII